VTRFILCVQLGLRVFAILLCGESMLMYDNM
jgi:hypothetical protein